ncbi:ERCC4 domain-containing protein [Endogone sp. FLAS-F59071]|nr:ERCC4 domain-containing protein [Endogone sp. FLAS-F59071]|eukprot:RUS21004.1 ERCC4 domain-containing protein [Endogone sp. FLAS-F59071]
MVLVQCDPALSAMATRVLALCHQQKRDEVLVDLQKTRSVELTVNRIFDGSFLEGTVLDPSLKAIVLEDNKDENNIPIPHPLSKTPLQNNRNTHFAKSIFDFVWSDDDEDEELERLRAIAFSQLNTQVFSQNVKDPVSSSKTPAQKSTAVHSERTINEPRSTVENVTQGINKPSASLPKSDLITAVALRNKKGPPLNPVNYPSAYLLLSSEDSDDLPSPDAVLASNKRYTTVNAPSPSLLPSAGPHVPVRTIAKQRDDSSKRKRAKLIQLDNFSSPLSSPPPLPSPLPLPPPLPSHVTSLPRARWADNDDDGRNAESKYMPKKWGKAATPSEVVLSTDEEDNDENTVPKAKRKKTKKRQDEGKTGKSQREIEKEEAKRKKEEAKLEKQREREAKKLEKEREKEAKRIEREQKKAEKEALKQHDRDLRTANKLKIDKVECTQEMIVDLERTLSASPLGALIRTALEPREVETAEFDHPVTNIVKWRRKVRADWDPATQSFVPIANERVDNEQHVLVVIDAREFGRLVRAERDALARHVAAVKRQFEGRKVIYLVEGLEMYYKQKKLRQKRVFEQAVRDGFEAEVVEKPEEGTKGKGRAKKKAEDDFLVTGPDKEEVEQRLTWMQLVERCLIVHTNDAEETAEWIGILTTDIATIPYKCVASFDSKLTLGFATENCFRRILVYCLCDNVISLFLYSILFFSNRNADLSFCVDGQVRSGVDTADTWSRMLQEIQLVTPVVARAIMNEYPTVRSLYEAYKQCQTAPEAEMLLADIEVQRATAAITGRGRTVGKAMSKRVYQIFMGSDPNVVIA